jgi:hypothetical protein
MQGSEQSTLAPNPRQVVRRWVSSKWPSGSKASEIEQYRFRGRLYETERFYSESGVYYHFIDRPAS